MIEPRPYQAQILKELKDLAAIALFMKTGSGKTYTALFKVRDNDTKSLLVICPKRIVEQWEESIKQVLPDYEIVEFKKSATSKERSDVLKKTKDYNKKAVIISLESVSRIDALPKIITEDWTVIVDESHPY